MEGRQHASEREVAYSIAVKDAVTKRLTHFTKGLNLSELAPHLLQHRILTTSEKEHLCDANKSRNEQILSLFNTFDTKGPLAFSLFAECLRNEDSHLTHGQLYDLIHEEVAVSLLPEKLSKKRDCEDKNVTILCKRTPCQLSLHGVLKGRKYDRMIRAFQTCQYNGGWAEMEAEASKYLREGVPCELQVAALLEKAMGLIFRKQEEETLRLVSEAKEKCKLGERR